MFYVTIFIQQLICHTFGIRFYVFLFLSVGILFKFCVSYDLRMLNVHRYNHLFVSVLVLFWKYVCSFFAHAIFTYKSIKHYLSANLFL